MSAPVYSSRDMQRILSKNGWTFQRHKGSHRTYTNKDGKHLTITANLCNYTILKLIKRYNLIVD